MNPAPPVTKNFFGEMLMLKCLNPNRMPLAWQPDFWSGTAQSGLIDQSAKERRTPIRRANGESMIPSDSALSSAAHWQGRFGDRASL